MTFLDLLVLAFAVGGAGAQEAVAEALQVVVLLDRRGERVGQHEAAKRQSTSSGPRLVTDSAAGLE